MLRSEYYIDERTKKEKKHWTCVDCGKDTWDNPRDYYMVKDKVWNKYGLRDVRGMICVGCFESRLGHKLKITEITLCPLNFENPYTVKIIRKSKVKK